MHTCEHPVSYTHAGPHPPRPPFGSSPLASVSSAQSSRSAGRSVQASEGPSESRGSCALVREDVEIGQLASTAQIMIARLFNPIRSHVPFVSIRYPVGPAHFGTFRPLVTPSYPFERSSAPSALPEQCAPSPDSCPALNMSHYSSNVSL